MEVEHSKTWNLFPSLQYIYNKMSSFNLSEIQPRCEQ